MKKFDSSKHGELIKKMPFSYISTSVYLDFCAYVVNRNGEDLVVKEDPISKEFDLFFLPEKKENWFDMSASMVTLDDLKKIKNHDIEIKSQNPTTTEFIYSTADFLNPTKKYKQKIRQFEDGYEFKVLNEYDEEKVKEFFNSWEDQKDDCDDVFSKESSDFFFFCLENLDKYNVEQVYVEVDGKLVGFVWGVKHSADKWVSLHIKSDYKYRGLSRFLNYEISKKFSDAKIVSLGTGCKDPGLIQNKKELGPIEEVDYYYVFTGGKVEKKK